MSIKYPELRDPMKIHLREEWMQKLILSRLRASSRILIFRVKMISLQQKIALYTTRVPPKCFQAVVGTQTWTASQPKSLQSIE